MNGEVLQKLGRVVGEANLANGQANSLVSSGTLELPGCFVVYPSSAAEVSEVMRIAWQHEIPTVPIGGGANAAPLEGVPLPCLFIDGQRLNHVTNLDEVSLVVHVQAGMRVKDLESLLNRRGLSLGDYPPNAMSSTIGGLLSVRTAGKSTRRHGFIEDAVLGISAVLPTGRSIHTRIAPRRATGPDLPRAFCGSEGTLGIITSAVIRLHRVPETRFLAAHRLPNMSAALGAIRLLLREEAHPSAMRLYDSAGAQDHYGKDVIDAGETMLLVATAGLTDIAACDRDLAASAVRAEGGTELPRELAEEWWEWRTGAIAPFSPQLQICSKPKEQLQVYDAVVDATRTLGRKSMIYLSRFDHDGAILSLWLERNGESSVGNVETLEAAEQAAVSAGGYPIGIGEPGWDEYYNTLKNILDPKGIMNPGVKIDSETPRPRPESVEDALF